MRRGRPVLSHPRRGTGRAIALLSFTLAALAAGPAGADILVLEGTLRDFQDSHPDFENVVCWLVPDLVEPTLGPDGLPVYGPNGPECIDSPASLAQWFTDVPGVNQTFGVTLELDNGQTDPGGVYSVGSDAFFPLDGQGFGDQGRDHNFHFTLEIRTLFTYLGGETFWFSGDDDVWVYIDGQRVVDLGGVHAEMEQFVDVDSLGLIPDETYTLDFFFAERHTTQSNFNISTSLALCSDADGDGHAAFDCNGRDCDDDDPAVSPSATELACDGLDNDCNLLLHADEVDDDGDGVDECGGDCDDEDPDTAPHAEEVCGDGVDNDCLDGDEPCPDVADDDDAASEEEGDDDDGSPADEGEPSEEIQYTPPGDGCDCALGGGAPLGSGFLLLLLAGRRRR